MSNRFVIDVNIGAQEKGQKTNQERGMAMVAGVSSKGLTTSSGVVRSRMKELMMAGGDELYSKDKLKEVRALGMGLTPGKLANPFIRNYHDQHMPDLDYRVETALGHGKRQVLAYAKSNQKLVKGLGVAAGYKGVSAAMEMNAYTSGDQVHNQKIQQGAKMAAYATAITLSGFNPFVIAGIAANEGINSGVQLYKFNYDRKMERSQITNSEMVLGDISYGRRRGGA